MYMQKTPMHYVCSVIQFLSSALHQHCGDTEICYFAKTLNTVLLKLTETVHVKFKSLCFSQLYLVSSQCSKQVKGEQFGLSLLEHYFFLLLWFSTSVQFYFRLQKCLFKTQSHSPQQKGKQGRTVFSHHVYLRKI